MQADMLHLAERLVVAVERMSQDMNNISAYVYDLSYSVQHFINEKREKEDISQFSCGGSPSGRSENSCQIEQEDGTSVSHVDDLQNKGSSAGDVASMNVDHNENSDVMPADITEVEDVIDISDDSLPCQEEANVPVPSLARQKKGSSEEINQRPHLQSSGLSSGLETPSSLPQSPSAEAMGIKTEDHFLTNSCPPERGTVFLQNLQGQMPLAVASSSTANVILGESETADRALLEGCGENQFTGAKEDQNSALSKDRTCASYQVSNFERLTHGPASSRSSSEGNEMGIRKKAFECFRCKKQFALNSMLVNHVRKHIIRQKGERPFICNHCGKSFKRKDYLSTHVQFHNSERCFKCSSCERAFVQKSDLKKHMRIHTGEKPFKCSVCGKSFAWRYGLIQHMITHRGRQPYDCTVCGEHCASLRELSVHLQHVHAATSSAS